MTAHFNLVVLSNNLDENNAFDAQQPEATAIDIAPSTSTANDETYPKVPSRLHSASRDTQRVQLTRAISPTCCRDYGPVNRVPAGNESDDSWGQSDTHELEPTHGHAHNIVPLLAVCTWRNSPNNRGRGQPQRQNNNINVRASNAPYSRPWEGQPYRRHTQSQQALRAWAYHKWQCRYPVPGTIDFSTGVVLV